MLHKIAQAEFKALDDSRGEFEALVSVFGNVDSVGDRVQPNAFSKTLDRWRSKGDPIPVVLSHQWDDPFSILGTAAPTDVRETARGLVAKGRLDIETNDVAAQVYRLMKNRSLTNFSFGYTVPKGGEKLAKDGAIDLNEIDLVEFGPCLKGANNQAGLLSVKSALESKQMGGDVLRMLNSMIGQCQEYMDAEQDPADVATMRGVLKTLQGLLRKDTAEGEKSLDGKAVWSTAYVNGLPDSAFLYVESGGAKDSEGKTTPRELRHFPYRDDTGATDEPHLRNALARIPQSNLPQAVKDRVSAEARQILNGQKSAIWQRIYEAQLGTVSSIT